MMIGETTSTAASGVLPRTFCRHHHVPLALISTIFLVALSVEYAVGVDCTNGGWQCTNNEPGCYSISSTPNSPGSCNVCDVGHFCPGYSAMYAKKVWCAPLSFLRCAEFFYSISQFTHSRYIGPRHGSATAVSDPPVSFISTYTKLKSHKKCHWHWQCRGAGVLPVSV